MASKTEIIDCIEALAVHCRPPLMTTDQRELWMRTWCEDLSQFPADAIAGACRKWRQSEQSKFPTPGQLLPLVRASLPVDRGEKAREWRELSPEDYAQLTVREKIRHQLIQASEARRKAGPMSRRRAGSTARNPKIDHLTPGELPDVWHRWTGIAEDHEREAARLRAYIRSDVPRIEGAA